MYSNLYFCHLISITIAVEDMLILLSNLLLQTSAYMLWIGLVCKNVISEIMRQIDPYLVCICNLCINSMFLQAMVVVMDYMDMCLHSILLLQIR